MYIVVGPKVESHQQVLVDLKIHNRVFATWGKAESWRQYANDEADERGLIARFRVEEVKLLRVAE